MQHPSNQQIQPIDSLTPFLGGKWWIRARVTDKSDVRTWNKPTSQGKLFSFTLIDESASIRATVFNDAVDLFNPLIVNGQVYYLSGGQVKNANRKFSNVNNDYELTFDSSSQISLARDPSSATIPLQRYNFLPIAILKQREVGSLVDVLAVVLSVEELSSITQKSTGRELIKRNVKVGDITAAVEVTLWNDQAKEWAYSPGTVLAMRQLKVGSFDGVTLSATFQSAFDVNPNIPDVKKLAEWYISTGGRDVSSLSSLGVGAGNNAGGENYRGRKYFDDISAEGLGRGPKADFIDVRCVPVYLKQDAQWYDACPQCNKKVTLEGAQGERYRCEKCDRQVVPTQRYLVSIQASDNVSQKWLTLFNEAGVEFFGMPATELKKQQEADPMFVTKIAQLRMNRPVQMRLRVKEESSSSAAGGEESDRVRLTVMRLNEFMPLDTVSEEKRQAMAAQLKTECEEMVRCIEAYL
ncbi:Replication factor A protein 1 [Trypanosoma cruzi]|uniref:Replication protein A subunit n=2 Tax=Trypanosoma cruzi TaxID=5693 RepID=Q4DXC9_TRYCC|nr:replication factor A, 51kDa subunit, putative [Trypanosoma cruzi]EAN97168.1 replication factor A, 51kDa subunit, putative [Trypanosoma cruzi]PWV07560.1 Replication factor A protein 1 [Trypanosoma cruzi]|eukprot:XP_819019.1 replication factor A, 51kDa subunit [Trypanosoma cruzi strain CL Brener]